MNLVIRWDDFGAGGASALPVTQAMTEELVRRKAPVIAAVTPLMSTSIYDPANTSFVPFEQDPGHLALLKERLSQGWQLALHGLTHQRSPSYNWTEFARQSRRVQSGKIRKGLDLLHALFPETPIDMLVLPWNSYDRNTLVCASEHGLRSVATGPKPASYAIPNLIVCPSMLEWPQFIRWIACFGYDDLAAQTGPATLIVTLHNFELPSDPDAWTKMIACLDAIPSYGDPLPPTIQEADFAVAHPRAFQARLLWLARHPDAAAMPPRSAQRQSWRDWAVEESRRRSIAGIKWVGRPILRWLRKARGLVRSLSQPIDGWRTFKCPICGYRGPFLEMSGRIQAQCPVCDSLERHRFYVRVLRRQLALRPFIRPALVIAPDHVARLLREFAPRVVTGDLFRTDVDRQFSVEQIPFPDASFDVVMAHHVMDEVDDDRAALKECYRVLASGGWLLAPVPTPVERTQELDERRRDGKIRLAGKDYYDRYLEAGFEELCSFRSTDYPDDVLAMQTRVFKPGQPPFAEELTIYAKQG